MSKKIKEITITYTDGTEEKLYPEPSVKTGPITTAEDDPIGGDGGETPTKPPGNP